MDFKRAVLVILAVLTLTLGPAHGLEASTDAAKATGAAAQVGMSEAVLEAGVTLVEEAVDRDEASVSDFE